VFENRVLRKLFVSKKDEMRGGRRKLHNDELHNVYPSPNMIGMMKLRRVTMEVKRNAYRLLWKSQKERDSRTTRASWEDNVRVDLRELG
jgi:hypothetical protein